MFYQKTYGGGFVFVYSFKASRVKAFFTLCLCVAAVVAAIILLPDAGSSLNVNKIEGMKKLGNINADKAKGRLEYFSALGYKVEEEPVSKDSEKLPETLDAVTEKYNGLQRGQGFDLTRYCGKKLESYTYEVVSFPDGKSADEGTCFATLIVYKGKVVGADVTFPKTGRVSPLIEMI